MSIRQQLAYQNWESASKLADDYDYNRLLRENGVRIRSRWECERQ